MCTVLQVITMQSSDKNIGFVYSNFFLLQVITMQSSDKNIGFVYCNLFLLSYIIEIHGATKVEKFR